MNDIQNHGLPRWKRTMDVIAIVMALPIMLPLAIIIGIVIHLVSAGPILFTQERVGYRGSRFMCLKFRTMHCGMETDADQEQLQYLTDPDEPMTKMNAAGDSRFILFGRFLRCSGLDDLPQFLNVLKGEMSLVGPRPCLASEAILYLPWQMERFNAVPGLTGLWQVNGKSRTTFTRMVQLDVEYARTKSLLLDLKVILKTIPAVLIQMRDTRVRRKAQSRPA